MSTHNLCLERKYEKYQNFSSENFHFLVVKFSVYLNRRVLVMSMQHQILVYSVCSGLSVRILRVYWQGLRKETLEQMRTVKIQISLLIHGVWSESLLFAYTISGPCRRCRTNSEGLDLTGGCLNWSGASPFVYAQRAFSQPAAKIWNSL